MPEGDTLFKLARRLREPLVGAAITRAWGRQQGEIRAVDGGRINAVSSLGKNLLIEVDGGWSFRVHLGIGGRGALHAQGERWRGRRSDATLVVETEGHVVVFFRAPQARLERSAHLRADPGLRNLGPDLLADDFDVERSLARLRKPRRADLAIGVALLDQRVAAGIGNAYKSDLLFSARLDPWALVRELDDDTLRGLYTEARELLLNNLGDGPRVTVPESIRRRGATHWVYRRTKKPCFRCGQPIRGKRQGEQARMTYWCPGCQRGPARRL